jgi:aromatic-L-amino-acid/L-tryptophan decarboxylase
MSTLQKVPNLAAEETLDPNNWADLQALSHQIVDDAIHYLRDIRDRPVWQDMPADVKASFDAPLPHASAPLAEVYREVTANVMSYPMGNVHPRFWSWYMASSNFTGALADFLAAIQGSNLGGGNHAAAYMDQQVVNWCKEMMGFPASASGSSRSAPRHSGKSSRRCQWWRWSPLCLHHLSQHHALVLFHQRVALTALH